MCFVIAIEASRPVDWIVSIVYFNNHESRNKERMQNTETLNQFFVGGFSQL